MKCVMYHYIRNKDVNFPYSKVLTKTEFNKQLKKFEKNGFINNYSELFENSKKMLLTFDDGFKDHIYAAEKLKKLNCTGLFFIPTLPLRKKEILDVHKVHLLVGKVKGKTILFEMEKYLQKNNITNLINLNEKKKYKIAYKHRGNVSEEVNYFKKLMNYIGDIKLKKSLLDHLLKEFEIKTRFNEIYLSKKDIRYIESLGMIIGSHADNHTLLSRLNYKKQMYEIKTSKEFLENIIKKKIDIFCYPYGTKISYNSNTLKILKKLNFKLAYSVNSKDIKNNDLTNRPLELPRYDCNVFN